MYSYPITLLCMYSPYLSEPLLNHSLIQFSFLYWTSFLKKRKKKTKKEKKEEKRRKKKEERNQYDNSKPFLFLSKNPEFTVISSATSVQSNSTFPSPLTIISIHFLKFFFFFFFSFSFSIQFFFRSVFFNSIFPFRSALFNPHKPLWLGGTFFFFFLFLLLLLLKLTFNVLTHLSR